MIQGYGIIFYEERAFVGHVSHVKMRQKNVSSNEKVLTAR